MTTQRILVMLSGGLFLTLATLAFSGCGGGGNESGVISDVEAVGPTNPAPGVVPIDEEYKSMEPEKKAH